MPEPPPIHLPVFQNFDCHSCTYCCRSLVVNVTDAEQDRILNAGWAQRISDHPLFVKYRYRGQPLSRLARQKDGRCVFLADDNRCRLHSETGLAVKPLACRLYPFVPTPGADGTVRLDLRADCPSVAANQGRPLLAHAQAIRRLVRETGAVPMSAPPMWRGSRRLSPREFQAVVAAFIGLLCKGSLALRSRLRAGCNLLDMLYTIRTDKVEADRFEELLTMLAAAAVDDVRQAQPDTAARPRRRADRLFRQWLFLHALADEPEDLDVGWPRKVIRSLRRYGHARRFARAAGRVPSLAHDWPATDFASVSRVQAGPEETLEPLCRSMRLKLDTHAFAGPGYYGYDVIAGLTALWLLPPVVGWFARLSAVQARRDILSAEDVLAGLRRAHHTYGVSPLFVRVSERLRLRALAHLGVPASLLARYGP